MKWAGIALVILSPVILIASVPIICFLIEIGPFLIVMLLIFAVGFLLRLACG
jgi:hypothetical protein